MTINGEQIETYTDMSKTHVFFPLISMESYSHFKKAILRHFGNQSEMTIFFVRLKIAFTCKGDSVNDGDHVTKF